MPRRQLDLAFVVQLTNGASNLGQHVTVIGQLSKDFVLVLLIVEPISGCVVPVPVPALLRRKLELLIL